VRPEPGRPGRARRTADREDVRRRQVAVTGGGLLALALVVGLLVALFGGDDAPGGSSSPLPDPDGSPSAMVALSVTGAPHALLAVVGSGGTPDPAALVLPPGTTVEVPGQGEATVEDVQALAGDSMRTAISNALGAWAARFGVLDLAHLAGAIDRAGGLRVSIPDPVTVEDGQVLGPGDTTLTGPQTSGYLAVGGDDATLRWMVVLEALVDQQILQASDFTESDDAEGAIAILAGADGAAADLVPIQLVGGSLSIPAQPDLDLLMGELFATSPPVPVIVQNGSGRPGVGEGVAARILPVGFRVVLSQNAESFKHDVTEITATGDEHVDDAEAIRDALGVGTVQVTQVPSGLADVAIVVGKDFEA